MLSPRSALIRRLIAERKAKKAAGTPGTSRTLIFEDAVGADRRAGRAAEQGGNGRAGGQAHVDAYAAGGGGADAFVGLHPVS
eukprot:2487338-Pleurochrysis_carterae.AAC.1